MASLPHLVLALPTLSCSCPPPLRLVHTFHCLGRFGLKGFRATGSRQSGFCFPAPSQHSRCENQVPLMPSSKSWTCQNPPSQSWLDPSWLCSKSPLLQAAAARFSCCHFSLHKPLSLLGCSPRLGSPCHCSEPSPAGSPPSFPSHPFLFFTLSLFIRSSQYEFALGETGLCLSPWISLHSQLD